MKRISVFYMKGDEEHRQIMYVDTDLEVGLRTGIIRGWDTEEQNHKEILIPWDIIVRIEVRA